MSKWVFVFVLFSFTFISTLSAKYRDMDVLDSDAVFPVFVLNTDTIFQIDTVFQFEYVYDTIYYYDSIPVSDTIVSIVNSVEASDSVTIVNQTYDILIVEKRTIYADKDKKQESFPGRDLREINQSEIPEIDFEEVDVSSTPPEIQKRKRRDQRRTSPDPDESFIQRTARDTLFRFDTIVNFMLKYDTVFFENSLKFDTTISNKTIYQNLGSSVIVKETVNMKVVQKENVFSEKTNRGSSSAPKNKFNKHTRRTSSISASKYRGTFSPTNRLAKEYTYAGALNAGVSLFVPEVEYVARTTDLEAELDTLNQNQNPEISFGAALTYSYFRNRIGLETGLGFSQYNFSCSYPYEELVVDSSWYWDYYEKEVIQYDTIWYVNLDTLLQTGDTLLVPSVDSAMVWVTDSTSKVDLDSSYVSQLSKSNYSLSFLEIPILGHFTLLDRKCTITASVGLIPMFLISKSGGLSYPESKDIVNANDISFDVGFALSFYGAFDVSYRVGKRWVVFAQPFIRRNIFSAIQNDKILLKVNSWGVKAGVSYRLFNFHSK